LSKLRGRLFTITIFHGIYRVRIFGLHLLRSIFGVVVPSQPCDL